MTTWSKPWVAVGACLALAACSKSPEPTPPAPTPPAPTTPVVSTPPSLTGSWSFGAAETGGGWLKTVQSGASVRFQLELSRGGPSYNSGFIEGEVVLAKGQGTFQPPGNAPCLLHFTFQRYQVVIQEQGSGGLHDCGFGNGVTATGTYQLDSPATPSFSKQDARVSPT